MSHAAQHHDTNELGWNPLDPHGTNTHAHGHVVVGWKLQLGVLAALLFFTVLTVGFYNAEKWAEEAFLISLPNWVNIVGAMSIASIKATLVCMYFMQLRYDKPLNTFALLFCLFAVGLFLFFSMLDLSTRGWVNDFKFGEISDGVGSGNPGGTGVGLSAPPRDANFAIRFSPMVETSGGNLIDTRRKEAIAKYLEEHPGKAEGDWWKKKYAEQKHPHKHPADVNGYFEKYGFGHAHEEVSTADRRVVRNGRSNALELSEDAGHGSDHSGTHSDASDH